MIINLKVLITDLEDLDETYASKQHTHTNDEITDLEALDETYAAKTVKIYYVNPRLIRRKVLVPQTVCKHQKKNSKIFRSSYLENVL